MKTNLPTSKRQLKKLHAKWTSGELTVALDRHTAAGNKKGVAKLEEMIAHAIEYDNVLAADAAHKAELDATRLEREKKAEADMIKRMGVPKDKFLASKAK